MTKPGFAQRLARAIPIVEFLRLESAGGLILLANAVIALIWANSPWAQSYFDLWALPVGFSFGGGGITMSLGHWINDALMALFFLVVGLEIKRELLVGELASPRDAALPIAAAVGGMAIPAALYAIVNAGQPGIAGWGVPMATDIAFALGVLSLLGPRVPLSLRIFLTALAIVDDMGAVLVIALFYTGDVSFAMLGGAAVALAFLFVCNAMRVRGPLLYCLGGILVWLFVLNSGVHATIAGVLVALAIPARVRLDREGFVRNSREILDAYETSHAAHAAGHEVEEEAAASALQRIAADAQMPVERVQNALHPWVTFFIMPVFALANAGVSFAGGSFSWTSSIPLGIILGLVIGKPVGIALFAWLAVKAGWAKVPEGVKWRQIIGVGCIGGIGFTMSLFVASLAFPQAADLEAAKLGILAGSLLAGILGTLMLLRGTRETKNPAQS